MMKTAAISFGAVVAILTIYVVAFLNWTHLILVLPASWVGAVEPIFQPAESIQLRIDHSKSVKEWRRYTGAWVATYPEDWDATFEIVEFEKGRFQIRSEDKVTFIDDEGSELLLGPGGGALVVSETHSAQVFPPDNFLFIRVSKLPLNGQQPVEYGVERLGTNRSEQAGAGNPIPPQVD